MDLRLLNLKNVTNMKSEEDEERSSKVNSKILSQNFNTRKLSDAQFVDSRNNYLELSDVSDLIVSNKTKILKFFDDVSKISKSKCEQNFGIYYNLSDENEQKELYNFLTIGRLIKFETLSSFKCSPFVKKVLPNNKLGSFATRKAMFSSENLKYKSEEQSKLYKSDFINEGNVKDEYKIKLPNGPKENHLFSRISQSSKIEKQHEQLAAEKLKLRYSSETIIRAEKSKRALFSPDIKSEDVCTKSLKRKCFSEYEIRSKIPKLDSHEINIGKEKINKNGEVPNHSNEICRISNLQAGLQRSNSDSSAIQPKQLSENRKKKLLWAVSQALQSEKVGICHPDFKTFVSILARGVKRLFLEFYSNSNSASETFLKLCRKYVHSVLNGKTADDIYLLEKNLIQQKRTRTDQSLQLHRFGSNKSSCILNNNNKILNTRTEYQFKEVLLNDIKNITQEAKENSPKVEIAAQKSSQKKSKFLSPKLRNQGILKVKRQIYFDA